MSPGEVRKPTTPQNAAGVRSEPPRSEPWASGAMPVASATAAPPLEPPQVSAVFHGLRVAPKTALKVLPPAPNSGVLVLPTTIAPGRLSRSTYERVLVRHVVLEDLRAPRGPDALGGGQVLDRDRDAVQRTERAPGASSAAVAFFAAASADSRGRP